ncbi:MAG: hypothetical protein N3A60_08410, partial [Thermanaerothrix sp.]|nr:hypothetical protein [Thermanaerothrix sp.]
MRRTLLWVTLSIPILALLIAGCFPLTQRPSPNQAATYAAQTVEARLTEMALQTPVSYTHLRAH